MTIPQILSEWQEYLADSLKPLSDSNATEDQRWFARYQTGGRILELREHTDMAESEHLLFTLHITPSQEHEYKRMFLREVRNYVRSQEERH